MTTTHTYHYRGYDIVPQRQWASWRVGIYATRANLPLMSQSTLRTLAPRKEDAVAEAKHSIDYAGEASLSEATQRQGAIS